MQTQRRRRKPMADINIVPYIDVMLVLLVIFMITAPLLTQGVQVNLPQAVAKPIENKQKEPIIVSVDARGDYFLNINSNPDQAIDPKALADRVAVELQTSKQSGAERQVLVKGDQSVDYGKIVQAMVLLQQAGAQTIGLMTKPPES